MAKRVKRAAAVPPPQPVEIQAVVAATSSSATPRPSVIDDSPAAAEALAEATRIVDATIADVQLAPPSTTDDCRALFDVLRARLTRPDGTRIASCEVTLELVDPTPLRERRVPDDRPLQMVVTAWAGRHRDHIVSRVVPAGSRP